MAKVFSESCTCLYFFMASISASSFCRGTFLSKVTRKTGIVDSILSKYCFAQLSPCLVIAWKVPGTPGEHSSDQLRAARIATIDCQEKERTESLLFQYVKSSATVTLAKKSTWGMTCVTNEHVRNRPHNSLLLILPRKKVKIRTLELGAIIGYIGCQTIEKMVPIKCLFFQQRLRRTGMPHS